MHINLFYFYLDAVVTIASTASNILCRAESAPMVISVPQKSLSMEPTYKWKWSFWFKQNIANKIKPKESLLSKISVIQINLKYFFYHQLFGRKAEEENLMNFHIIIINWASWSISLAKIQFWWESKLMKTKKTLSISWDQHELSPILYCNYYNLRGGKSDWWPRHQPDLQRCTAHIFLSKSGDIIFHKLLEYLVQIWTYTLPLNLYSLFQMV